MLCTPRKHLSDESQPRAVVWRSCLQKIKNKKQQTLKAAHQHEDRAVQCSAVPLATSRDRRSTAVEEADATCSERIEWLLSAGNKSEG